eukprot:417807-Hanusia_phi.AAC.1
MRVDKDDEVELSVLTGHHDHTVADPVAHSLQEPRGLVSNAGTEVGKNYDKYFLNKPDLKAGRKDDSRQRYYKAGRKD